MIFGWFQVGEDGDYSTECFADIRLEIFSDMMCIMDCPVTGYKQVDRNKAPRGSLARAQCMKIDASVAIGHHNLFDQEQF